MTWQSVPNWRAMDGMECKTSLSVDVLILGNWIHRIDAARSRGHAGTAPWSHTLPHEQSDLEGDSLSYWKPVECKNAAIRSHRWAPAVQLLALTEQQCSGPIVIVSTSYLLLMPIRHCSSRHWTLNKSLNKCLQAHLSETAWWPAKVSK